ncbi:hypothetical protein Pogu_0819 [Pyrobaculum oguniense TE7]|uniref:Uncharacterized protein n=1 Tax=Pyrobaculum oguniense (strain DSM 13380 / JCM 10595 / TE7) TaxID=698757 RepID=H6Q9L2_PYROT|nr:hypothetical protein Pogu_0819 [Pyrobaculum oguniense TE7]
MTIHGAAFPRPRRPHCHSANVVAVGEYVCRDCGTVIGPVLMPPATKEASPPPPKYRLIMAALEREGKSVRRRYSEIVEMYLGKAVEALGSEVAAVALEMFKRLAGLLGRRGLSRLRWRISRRIGWAYTCTSGLLRKS